LEQNTRVFQNIYGNPGRIQAEEASEKGWGGQADFEVPYQGYGDGAELYQEGYEAEYDPEYDQDQEYDEEYDDPQDAEDEDYSVYQDEADNTHRFHLAMNVFDTASVLAGVVVIFALSALIFSLFSWVRTDITHSFVILQNRIQ
jgi:hypothetical protein